MVSVTPPHRPAEEAGAVEGSCIWYSHGCHVSQLQHWVSVGQGQEMQLQREAEVPPGGLKGQADEMLLSSRGQQHGRAAF